MESIPTVLDLDETHEIPVHLAGRSFKLTQQRRGILMRVIKFVNGDNESEGKKSKEGMSDLEIMELRFENALPILALTLGFEQNDDTTKETIGFLKEHLTPSKAIKIFEAWWGLNEVADFFNRGGIVCQDPAVAEWMKNQRRAIVETPVA